MRVAAFLLLFAGLAALGGGIFMGCGSLFAWNGRHPIAVAPITIGTPAQQTFPVYASRRYSLAVQVVFDREGLVEQHGALVVEAKLPVDAAIRGTTGETQEISGWLDPNEPPTTLFGHRTDPEAQRHARGTPPPELAAQRMVGPFRPHADGEATFAVTLGADRVGRANIREVRAVVYDDQMPAAVKLPFVAAGVGAVMVVLGAGFLAVAFFRRKRGGSRRRKNV